MPTPTLGDFYANDVAFIGYGAQLLMGSAAGGATEESQSNAGGGAGAFASGGLMDVWRNREERNFRIVLSDQAATEWDFVGAVSRFQPGEIGLENIVTAQVEITPLRDSTEFLP
jgi:hypothetical protein